MRAPLLWLCGAAALAGLLRDWSVHGWKEQPWRGVPTQRADARYVGLAAALPSDLHARIGYLSDEPEGSESGGRRHFEARFALAPRLLPLDDGAARWVVADLVHPDRLEELARAHGLVPVLVLADGVALLERK